MRLLLPFCLLPFCTCTLLAQAGGEEDRPFVEETPRWWMPAGLLRLERERFDLEPGKPDFERTRARLHLRWEGGGDHLRWLLGSLHGLSNERNAEDLPRFENLRSNGSSLDLASLQLRGLGDSMGGDVQAGLLENPLLASEALWDPNLRVIGGGGRVFWRGESVEELGLRAVSGQVRLLAGGRVELAAAQAVFRFDTGPFQWTLHGGDWRMTARQEDAAAFHRQNPTGAVTAYTGYGGASTLMGYPDPQFTYRVIGFGLAWQGLIPIEVRGQRQMRTQDGDRGEELQVWIGSPRRTWWPQAGWIRQRLDPDGALGAVNGDQWWFHSNADGNLFVLALNLPWRLRLEARHLDQVRRGSAFTTTRDTLALTLRF